LDSFLHVVADGADGDLAVFIWSGFAIDGFHQGVGGGFRVKSWQLGSRWRCFGRLGACLSLLCETRRTA
jgi:hypothetical protein